MHLTRLHSKRALKKQSDNPHLLGIFASSHPRFRPSSIYLAIACLAATLQFQLLLNKNCHIMSLSAQEADDDNSGVFMAKMDSARNMSNILKAIHFKDVSVNCPIIAHNNGRYLAILPRQSPQYTVHNK